MIPGMLAEAVCLPRFPSQTLSPGLLVHVFAGSATQYTDPQIRVRN